MLVIFAGAGVALAGSPGPSGTMSEKVKPDNCQCVNTENSQNSSSNSGNAVSTSAKAGKTRPADQVNWDKVFGWTG